MTPLRKELTLALEETKKEFYPSQRSCRRWFRILNVLLFTNKLLEPERFEIGLRRGAWAYFTGNYETDTQKCYLTETRYLINYKFKSMNHFLNILAHEMVHHYQHMENDYGVNFSHHGKSFWKWKHKFEKFGLKLSRKG